MPFEAYFILKQGLSLKTKGISGKKYEFFSDKPTIVTDFNDAEVFKTRSDLRQTTIDGKALNPRDEHGKPASYRSLKGNRQNYIAQNLVNENIIEESFSNINSQQATLIQADFHSAPGEVSTVALDDPKEDEKFEQEYNSNHKKTLQPKQGKKSPVASKDGQYKCPKCKLKFNHQSDLEAHLEVHDEEDDE